MIRSMRTLAPLLCSAMLLLACQEGYDDRYDLQTQSEASDSSERPVSLILTKASDSLAITLANNTDSCIQGHFLLESWYSGRWYDYGIDQEDPHEKIGSIRREICTECHVVHVPLSYVRMIDGADAYRVRAVFNSHPLDRDSGGGRYHSNELEFWEENRSMSFDGCGECSSAPFNATSFTEEVSEIQARVIDLTAPRELFYDDRFVAVFENAEAHSCLSLGLLKDPGISLLNKEIVVYSMTGLDAECHVRFASEVYGAFRRGEVDPDVLYMVVGHSFDRRSPLLADPDFAPARQLIDLMLSDVRLPTSTRRLIETQFR